MSAYDLAIKVVRYLLESALRLLHSKRYSRGACSARRSRAGRHLVQASALARDGESGAPVLLAQFVRAHRHALLASLPISRSTMLRLIRSTNRSDRIPTQVSHPYPEGTDRGWKPVSLHKCIARCRVSIAHRRRVHFTEEIVRLPATFTARHKQFETF